MQASTAPQGVEIAAHRDFSTYELLKPSVSLNLPLPCLLTRARTSQSTVPKPPYRFNEYSPASKLPVS